MTAELDRFVALLTEACGITRTRVPLVDDEATVRAKQARDQVGLVYKGDESKIRHPSGDAIREALGWTGEPIGVGELAVWNYQWRDPIQAAVNGLMNSPEHRAVLVNPGFTHWGVGLYSEVAPTNLWPVWSNEALETRRYFIVWVATGMPVPRTAPPPLGLPPDEFLFVPEGPSTVVIGPGGAVNVRFEPLLGQEPIDFNTGTTGPYRAIWLGDVEGEAYFGNKRWSALWIPERGGFRYCHATLRSAATPLTL